MDFDFEHSVDLKTVGETVFENCQRLEKKRFTVKVVDSVADYTALMKSLFDFELLKQLI